MAAELKAELDAVEGYVPQYLYRTTSSTSNGRNSSRSFRPESPIYTNALSDLQHQHAKDMLEHHLLWHCRPNDQFISWTGSLLWALQHAIRKDFRGDTDVQICVLDTSKIETCSFFAASDLLRIYRVPDEDKLAHRYYEAEYLYHGGLFVHGCSRTVSLNLLREYGLFTLLPELDDLKFKPDLWKTVESLRITMVSVLRPVAPIEGRIALQLASLFEKDFTMPLMVALLSLRRRAPNDSHFLRLVSDYTEPSRDFSWIIPPYRVNSAEAPELTNFAQLMNKAYVGTVRTKSQGLDETTELGSALDALSASFDEVDTTIKQIPQTALTPGVLFQWSAATQALRNAVYVNWKKESGNRWLQSEGSRPKPKPFPARLPSGRIISIFD
ncbi:MAG: hypothetical protein ASARMPREDX12_007780 [Alectoria sarmentosa]|nr:MAG: hypothetical protein ASARMPREDX12_007780 [Alectoria sarmentosa]